MKNTFLASLLAVGLASSAFAATTPPNDLIMGFRDDGSANSGLGSTLGTTFDLGSLTQYTTGGVFATGVTIDTGINVGSLLTTNYGASYAADTGLFWGVVGTNGQAPGQRALFVSASATGATGTPTSVAWNDRSATSQSTQSGKFVTLGNNTTLGGGSTLLNTNAVSWVGNEGTNSVAFGAYNKVLFESVTGNGFADLYAMDPLVSTSAPGVFLGTFSIGGNGNVNFTSLAAIPEPSTYAAILGIATLGFAAIRRRQQSNLLA